MRWIPCTIKGKPLVLLWGRTPRLDSGVRVSQMSKILGFPSISLGPVDGPKWDLRQARVRLDQVEVQAGATGITNDHKDPSVDTFRPTTLFLKSIGVPAKGLQLKIKNHGIAPKDGDKMVGVLMFNLQTDNFSVDTHVPPAELERYLQSVLKVADAAVIPCVISFSVHCGEGGESSFSVACPSLGLITYCEPIGSYGSISLHSMALVAEVDCLLRPKEKIIVCDNVEIINEVEKALRSMHWKVQLSYSNDMDLKHSNMQFMPQSDQLM
ncbi:probable RNA 3'-terminal phosphate cyclase-like protein [Tanacetum coccineum]